MKKQVSLCMIVKDEEEYLAKCLDSVKDIVDEIIIVDTGSKDKTVEIAKQYGAKIYYFPWNNNFSQARNESLKHATKDWIFIIDADEELYREDKEKLIELLNGELEENVVYYFQGISYFGSEILEGNVTTNLNPRLFRNGRGIYYKGEVHNQLITRQNEKDIIKDSIKIYHYGYLDKRIEDKNKNIRNIEILKDQIRRNPEDKFVCFNLATEYYSLGVMEKALEFYYKSYEGFNPKLGYSSRLIIKMMIANYELKRFDEVLKLSEVGIKHFNTYVDLYYIKALALKELGRISEQIEALNRCIELGEAPPEFRYLNGTGSYAAYNELANAYMKLEDYESTYDCFVEVVKLRPDYIGALYNIIHILRQKKTPSIEIKKVVEGLFIEPKRAYHILAEAFYNDGIYDVSLEYIEGLEDLGIETDRLIDIKKKCIIEMENNKNDSSIDSLEIMRGGGKFMKNQTSLCMIVKNEEEYLPKCLNSVKDIVDEMIIVDTGSTDNTVEIAKSFGAKIYHFQWNNNFSEARNESLRYATKDWILILDADEELYQEDQQLLKALLNSDLDEREVYNFQGISYSGDHIDPNNRTTNLNPRLFKNKMGIHYEGAIHNQLIFGENLYNVICRDIKIHHYGYLSDRIKATDKRRRNMTILEEQLKRNPKDKYLNFNLGNEYAASKNFKKALECYYNVYEDFKPDIGFGAILIIRIVYTNYIIGEYSEALKFIGKGIDYYPKCTDLYFFRASISGMQNKIISQIKDLEKCIELGDSEENIRFIFGVGGFKAYNELGTAYAKLKEYDMAYEYYIKAVKAEADYIDPIANIIWILRAKNKSMDEIKKEIEGLFSKTPENYKAIADMLYDQGYYEVALEYLMKMEKKGKLCEATKCLKVKCLVRLGKFTDCISSEDIECESEWYSEFIMNKVLSFILIGEYEKPAELLKSIDFVKVSDKNKKVIGLCEQLLKIFTDEETTILSKDENETVYMDKILEILEIMLLNKKYDEFAIAVNLANLVYNKFALLKLGKLYYYNGYTELAKKEILRSIREFEVYDNEALDILKVI